MTGRPEDDPEIRKKRLEIDQAGDRARFEAKRNPLFALFALGRYRADEELPLWVRRWLLKFAADVLRAAFYWPATAERPEHDPTTPQAVQEMRRALGMPSRGRNAVENLHEFLDDDILAWLRGQGVSAKDLADRLGIDPTEVYRRTNRTYKRWPRIGPRRRPRAKK